MIAPVLFLHLQAKHNLRVSVTLRQYLIVIIFCHMWQLMEIFVRTTVANRLVPWLYVARALSLPMKATLSALVFESRGRFMSKYRNRLMVRDSGLSCR